MGSRLFPMAGLAAMRAGTTGYLLVTNGIVGTNGFGNHKHNDQLSFEYHFDGVPLVVDPGSYVYTSDPDARNLFRGTAYHNTVQIDSVEQNELKPEWLFRLLARRAIQPRIAKRISFDEVAEAHRRLEVGGLDGKLVLCPDLPSLREGVPPRRETGTALKAALRPMQ